MTPTPTPKTTTRLRTWFVAAITVTAAFLIQHAIDLATGKPTSPNPTTPTAPATTGTPTATTPTHPAPGTPAPAPPTPAVGDQNPTPAPAPEDELTQAAVADLRLYRSSYRTLATSPGQDYAAVMAALKTLRDSAENRLARAIDARTDPQLQGKNPAITPEAQAAFAQVADALDAAIKEAAR